MPAGRSPDERDVVARAKAAIAAGDRKRALALLHTLATRGPDTAAELPADVLDALVATASAGPAEEARAALASFARVQSARAEVERLIRGTPFNGQDLQALRRVLAEKERAVTAEAKARQEAERTAAGGAPTASGSRGYLELKWIPRPGGKVHGPYLYYRLKQGGHLRSRYIGKVQAER